MLESGRWGAGGTQRQRDQTVPAGDSGDAGVDPQGAGRGDEQEAEGSAGDGTEVWTQPQQKGRYQGVIGS